MFDFNTLGMKPRYAAGYLPPVSDEDIMKLEKQSGHVLPDHYKLMLKNYHGGDIDAKDFSVLDEETGIFLGYRIEDLYFVNEQKNVPANIWWAIENCSELIGPHTLPFGDDGYNNVYYMKWCGDEEPQIWVLLFSDDDAPQTVYLLPSFDALLGVLFNGD